MAAKKNENRQERELARTISQAEALLRNGKPAQAETLLCEGLGERPDNFDLLRLLGVANQFQGKNENAAGYFTKAIKIDPASAPTHYNLGITLSILKQFDKAADSLSRALEIFPDDADALGVLGNAFAALNRHEDAVDSLRSALEIEPGNALRHIKLGMSLQALERYEQALSCFHNAIELNPDDAAIHNLLGIVQNKVSQLDEAVASFRRAVEIKPNHPEAHNSLSATLINLKKYEEAVSSCLRAIEVRPDHAEAHNNMATSLNALKRHEEAIESCQRALEIKPDHAEAYNNMGIALNALKRHDEVSECYRRAIEINPDFADAYSNLGNYLNYLTRYEEAIDSYRRAIERNPDHAEAHNNMVNALISLMRNEEAVECARSAIKINPHLADAHSNLGIALACAHRYEDAISSANRALELKPELVAAHINLGSCLAEIGRAEEAMAALECALNISETPEQRARSLVALSALPKTAISIDLLASIDEVSKCSLDAENGANVEDLRIRLAFARAVGLDLQGRHEEAWDGFVEANREFNLLYAENQKSKLKKDKAACKAAQSWRGMERKAASATTGTPMSLFILGPSRSGKSSLEKLVGHLEGVKSGYENTILWGAGRTALDDFVLRAALRTEASNSSELGPLPNKLGKGISEHYLTELRRRTGQAAVFTNTSPGHITDVGWITECIPSTRFIFVKRRQEDNALRIFMKQYGKGRNYHAYDLENIFEYLCWYQQMTEEWLDKLPEITMAVSYEEMIADPKKTLDDVARFCGLVPHKDFSAELSGDVGCSEPYDKFLKLAKFPS